MILGRPPALFAAAFDAIVNAVVLLGLGGVSLDVPQVTGLNLAFAALIALIAGSPITDHAKLAAASAARKAKRQ